MECLNRDSLEIVFTGLYDNPCQWNVSSNKMLLIFKAIFAHVTFIIYQTRQMKFKKNNNKLQESVKLINL